MNLKMLLIIGGILVIIVSLLADQIGIGDGDGIGLKQSAGALVGAVVAIVGFTRKSK